MTASVFSNGVIAYTNNAAATAALNGTSVANDQAVAFGHIAMAGTGGTLATPSGYTQRISATSGSIMSYIFSKTAGASEGNPSLVPSGTVAGDHIGAVGVLLRGIDTTTPYHNSNGNSTGGAAPGTPINTAALTVTNNNCLLFLWVTHLNDTTTGYGAYNPNGTGNWTLLSFGTHGTYGSSALYYTVQTTATNISASTVTVNTGSAGTARTQLIAFNAGNAVSVLLSAGIGGGFQTLGRTQ